MLARLDRKISLGIAITYIALGLYTGLGFKVYQLVAFLIFPLAAIWFSEEMEFGSDVYQASLSRKTPAVFIWFGGWLLLLLPVVIGIVIYFSGKKS